jgi:hypothetical protein
VIFKRDHGHTERGPYPANGNGRFRPASTPSGKKPPRTIIGGAGEDEEAASVGGL